ncbi:NFACT family protein [Candidatus Bathyarchaeota archaeon]|nr:NFACT family protein [Candidatus Bathyarchaeota archaeon]
MFILEKKKAMTSYDISAIVKELREKIIKKKIDNVYQLNEKTFLFKLKPNQANLIIEIEKRIHLTSFDLNIPKEPTTFCKQLRNHIKGSTIEDITQHEFERVIILKLKTQDERKFLIAELFKRGNLILTSEDNKVLLALYYAKMKDRVISPGSLFKHAPSTGIHPCNLELNALKAFKTESLKDALLKTLAVGIQYVKEILARVELNENIKIGELSDEELKKIVYEVKNLNSNLKPCIVKNTSGDYVDVTPFQLKIYSNFEEEFKEGFNEAADEYFSKITVEEAEFKQKIALEKKLQTLKNLLVKHERRIIKLNDQLKKTRKKAEIIYKCANELKQIKELILKERRLKNENEILTTVKATFPLIKDYIEGLNLKNLIAILNFNGEVFSVDLKINPFDEASKNFEKAKEYEKKLMHVKSLIEKTKIEIDSLHKKIPSLIKPFELKKRKEKKWFEKFRWFKSSENFLVVIGKDSSTNEILIKHYTCGEDLVLHPEFHGAPFAVIKCEGKTPSEATIKEAAVAAASYSKAWSLGLGAVDVYWVKPNQISKKPPSGQYIEKGMFMIYGSRNYIRGVELKLSIGVIKEDEELKIICGPSSAINRNALAFVEIAPGEFKSKELAKQVIQKLFEKAPEKIKDRIKSLNLVDIQNLIPGGKGKIID